MNPRSLSREIIQGWAVPVDRADIDTDQIIPARWLRRVERTGYAAGLFEAWRRDPAFPLNDPRCAGATMLVAGANFGCGSSRASIVTLRSKRAPGSEGSARHASSAASHAAPFGACGRPST